MTILPIRTLFVGVFLLQPFIEEAAGFEFGIARWLAAEFVSIFCEEDFSEIKVGEVGKSFVQFIELGEVEPVSFRIR